MKIEWLDGQLVFRQGPRQLSSHKSAKFQTLGYLLEIPCDLSCAALSFNQNIPITLIRKAQINPVFITEFTLLTYSFFYPLIKCFTS